ncbi:MFS transporter [Kitasatospora sp. NPDC056138]|uniref:MFS transporter n=1 Tax=Kitasatospora sp. NPDC056138 TaxID=3345724 RepID=UPI0035DF5D2A
MTVQTDTADERAPRPVPPRRLLSNYRELLAIPGVSRMVVASLASKLPLSMIGLSLLLFIGPRHSYATAGLAVSCMAIGQGLSAPIRGRLMDRHSSRVITVSCLAAYLVVLAALVAVARSRVPVPLLLVLATLSGITMPPVGITMRTLWRSVAGEHRLVTAMALDSAVSDVSFITGPAVAAWLCLNVSDIIPFVLFGLLMITAVVLVLSLPPISPPVRRPGGRHWAGPLRSSALCRLLIVNAAFSSMITAIDVVVPILNAQQGTGMYNGLDLGALSAGSIIGSLALGALPGLLAHAPKIAVLLGVFATGAAVLAAASQLSPLAMALACPVAGLAYGSTFGALLTAGGNLAPEGCATETQGWLSSLMQGGSAVGASAAAWLAADTSSLKVLCAIPVLAALTAALSWNIRPRQD